MSEHENEYELDIGTRGQGLGASTAQLPVPTEHRVIGYPEVGRVRIATPADLDPDIDLRAFPGGGDIMPAEGFGASALLNADRENVQIFKVTSTNDSGAGTFKQALLDAQLANQNHLKIIVFHTGGYIDWTSGVRTPDDDTAGDEIRNLIIAAHTAPGDGATLRAGADNWNWQWHRTVEDIVIRGLRWRPGSRIQNKGTPDESAHGGQLTFRSGTRVILDHCSSSWSVNRNIHISWFGITRSQRPRDITIQNCLFGETISGIDGSHRATYQTGTTDARYDPNDGVDVTSFLSLHNNLVVHGHARNPNMRSIQCSEWINNSVYNYNRDAGWLGSAGILDLIGNWIKKGPWRQGTNPIVPYGIRLENVIDGSLWTPSYYMTQNISLGGPFLPDQLTDASADNWSNQAVTNNRSGAEGLMDWYYNNYSDGDNSNRDLLEFRRLKRLWDIVEADNPHMMHEGAPLFPVTIIDPYVAHAFHMSDVGAGACIQINEAGEWVVGVQDDVDARYRTEVDEETGINNHLKDEEDVGGYPTLDEGSAPQDTNGDGIPDAFYSKWGYTPSESGLAGTIVVGGYCLAECYVNGISPVDGSIQVAGD